MRAAIFSMWILANSIALADDGQPASVATMPPVVVKTIPEAGTTDVDPTLTELRATFSKPMIAGNFSWVQTIKDAFPATTAKPHFEPDGRTCVLPVKLEPGKTYVLWLNQGKFLSFMDKDGRRAIPYMLVFETKASEQRAE